MALTVDDVGTFQPFRKAPSGFPRLGQPERREQARDLRVRAFQKWDLCFDVLGDRLGVMPDRAVALQL